MNNKQLRAVLTQIDEKLDREIDRLGDGIPYISDKNGYKNFPEKIYWWTNGFWPGILWLRYADNGMYRFKSVAERIERMMDINFNEFTHLHHDTGFMWFYSSVKNFQQTRNSQSFARGMHAATILAGRYNPNGEFLRSWEGDGAEGWVIIDSLMNLQILFWASEVSNDPRFKSIAKKHALTVLKNHVRSNGSVKHICNFDAETGEYKESLAGQGYSPTSAWSRGQAWAIYGFSECYRNLNDERFLRAAENVADFTIRRLENNEYVAPIDYYQPSSVKNVDTSASIITSCGLLNLMTYVSEDKQNRYLYVIKKVFNRITQEYLDLDIERDGLVTGFSSSYTNREGQDISSVYGDYYFIELIQKLMSIVG